MQRELGSFALAPAQRSKLQAAGFTTAQDVLEIKPSQLSKEIDVSLEESLAIWKLVKGDETDDSISKQNNAGLRGAQSALAMLQDEQSQQVIITFSQELDSILGGGVPLTKITEICGAPGIGKTQICMQLCVDVQIPAEFGGLEGEAVYIDTEGSFIIDRLVDITTATIQHCTDIARSAQDNAQLSACARFTKDSILSGLHYFRCHDYVELIALVHTLPEFLNTHKKVRLVVVDSIAFHFRHDFDDYSLRTRLLNGMAQMFIKMAFTSKLAVVLTNQMTTKFTGSGSSQLIPALGESWGHAATIRLILHWENQIRRALLYKSPTHPETSVSFQITMGGIRDLHDAEHIDEQSDANPAKRQCTSTR